MLGEASTPELSPPNGSRIAGLPLGLVGRPGAELSTSGNKTARPLSLRGCTCEGRHQIASAGFCVWRQRQGSAPHEPLFVEPSFVRRLRSANRTS